MLQVLHIIFNSTVLKKKMHLIYFEYISDINRLFKDFIKGHKHLATQGFCVDFRDF